MAYINLIPIPEKTKLVTPYLGIFTFKPESPDISLPNFDPGQFVPFGVGEIKLKETADDKRGIKEIKGLNYAIRRMSIASAPEFTADPNNPMIEFYIAMIENGGGRNDERGVMTTPLFYPSANTKYIMFDKASGDYVLPEHSTKEGIKKNDKRTRLLTVTGTGLATEISRLRSESVNRENTKFILIHGVSYHRDLTYSEELEELTTSSDIDFEYYHTASRESCESCLSDYVEELFYVRDIGRKGRINSGDNKGELEKTIKDNKIQGSKISKIIGHELSPDKDLVLICGHPDVIDNIETILVKGIGFEHGKDVLSDKYW